MQAHTAWDFVYLGMGVEEDHVLMRFRHLWASSPGSNSCVD